jgi:hypothetical protein
MFGGLRDARVSGEALCFECVRLLREEVRVERFALQEERFLSQVVCLSPGDHGI